ncbi:MAG: sigma 54-interacting transcriptional regulator [Planctomycetota bacterium]
MESTAPRSSPAGQPVQPSLPAGWLFDRELAAGAQGQVVRVRRGGEFGVLRLLPAADARRGVDPELALLARVRHPSLARLLDHGVLDGRPFTLRSWIEGEDLARVGERLRAAGDPGHAELGRLVARLCAPLDAIHRAGFVHADLKATNVIVRAGSEPVITDFGLSHARLAANGEGVSGSLFALAPELLLGGRIDGRADLFALGVLLHELLLGRRVTAREFYGRFPEQDFFTAAGTRVEELPEWARDVVAQLVERDPAARPDTALEVARRLGPRLGLELGSEEPGTLGWSVSRGRERWFEEFVESTRAAFEEFSTGRNADTPLAPRWITVVETEGAQAVLSALRLALALHGSPVHALELARVRRELTGGRDLDRWLLERSGSLAGGIVFAAPSGSPWDERIVEGLARSLAQAQSGVGGEPTLLVVCAAFAPVSTDLAWERRTLVPIDAATIERELGPHLDESAERVRSIARELERACGGSAARLDARLRAAAAAGALLHTGRGLRIAPGGWARLGALDDARRAERLAALGAAARRALGGLLIAGGRALLAELGRGAGLDGAALAAALAELEPTGYVERSAVEEGTELRSIGVRPRELLLSSALTRELHALRAAELERANASPGALLPHRWAARLDGGHDAAALELVRRLREAGQAEQALEVHAALRSAAESIDAAMPSAFEAEAALCWIALGRPERALDLVRGLDDAPSAAERAHAACVHGAAAILRHDWAVAEEQFVIAATLRPDDPSDAWHGLGRVYFESRRDAELDKLAEDARARVHAPLAARVIDSLDNLRAMSAFRRGDPTTARAQLERGLQEACNARDAAREAGVRINLATVLRRSGAIADALAHARRSQDLYDEAGHLPGLAQARALVAGILRDQGELGEAAALFTSALALRERLGDASGAAAVRGMLGLVLAERGHARSAELELASAARALERGGRASFAMPLAARAEELRVRFAPPGRPAGVPARRTEGERAAEADPRLLTSRARVQWLAFDRRGAVETARRAGVLAARLGHPLPEAEAHWLLDALRRTGERSVDAAEAAPLANEADVAPLVHEDRIVFDHLVADLGEDAAAHAAMACVRGLVECGRDDRAARLAIAIAARCPAPELAREAAALAETAFARCAAGLGADEAARLRRTLLSMPDPWPADLDARTPTANGEEELEMDVVALLDINHRLVKQEALRDLLGAIVEGALGVTGAERGFLVLEEDGELSFDTALDSRRGDIAAPDLEVSKSIVRQALDAGRVLRLSNAVDDPQLAASPSVVALELRSILCAPFQVEPGLRGVIYLDHRLQRGAFAARAERLLALLADQAALAVRQVRRVEEIRRLNRELSKQVQHKESDLRAARAALREANVALPASGMVGNAPPMRAVHKLIERAAPSKLSVLVVGESGTGKELVARALHSLSPRAAGPFVSENCAAFPESLIESELFGYKKGAFTGADSDRPGLFERAEGGTLFLDEIGELPLALQAKLLRVLETGEVRRVGDSRVRHADFRLVAATNRDLEAEVREGRFRADLFYRLDGLRVALPALRERIEDVPELVDHFLRLENARTGLSKKVDRAVVARLCRRAWPGNVRELANEVTRLYVLSEGDVVDPELVRTAGATREPASSAADPFAAGVPTLEELEKRAILRALELASGDKRKAAEMLGISRAKVYQRLKDWRLDGGDAGKEEA